MKLDCLLPYGINQTVATTLFAQRLIYIGCILETDQKYGLIAWTRKGPISKDKCPFLVHILSRVRAFMTRAYAIVHRSSSNLKLKLTK